MTSFSKAKPGLFSRQKEGRRKGAASATVARRQAEKSRELSRGGKGRIVQSIVEEGEGGAVDEEEEEEEDDEVEVRSLNASAVSFRGEEGEEGGFYDESLIDLMEQLDGLDEATTK